MADQTRASRQRKDKDVDLDKLGTEMGNKPPQALDFEDAVLGAMLIDPDCVDEALAELSPSCFYSPQNRIVYEEMSWLATHHIALDQLSVCQRLQAVGKLEDAGGSLRISDLSENIGAAVHVEYNIKILKQKAIQRDLIKASYEILKESYDDAVDVDNLISDAQTKVFAAIQSNVRKDVHDIGHAIRAAMDDIERLQKQEGYSGVPSGYQSIDKITMGWQPSDLIILAARPSVGKTAFALNIARNASVDYGYPVAFFSLEMPEIQLAKRLMTSESEFPADKIKGGMKLAPGEWDILESKLTKLSQAPLYVDDTPSLPIMEFRTKATRLVKQKGVRLIIVDYLQLMQGPSELRGMREQEVAAISRTLKATAKELNVPIIALSQLSRQAVQRTGGTGKPQLSDLRESGSIEQDADMVIFVHRPDYLGLSETPDGKETTEIIIAKHRNGEIADIPMRFKSDLVRFVEYDDTLEHQVEAMTYQSAMNNQTSYSPFEGQDSGAAPGGFENPEFH